MFCYQSGFAQPTKEVDCRQFWALVRAPRTIELIDNLRRYRAQASEARNQVDAEMLIKTANDLKRKLPAFIFQATFDETMSKKGFLGRWRKQAATRLTGLVVMDIDHVDDVVRRFAQWDVKQLDRLGVLLVYVTPSGHGLKVVFKARTEWGNLIDNQHAMAKELGVEIDESCKDASRMSFVCRAADIYFINEQELFTYENAEYAEKYNDQYRGGNSQPTLNFADSPTLRSRHTDGSAADVAVAEGETDKQAGDDVLGDLTYHGVSYAEIIDAWLDGKAVEAGDRHNTMLRLATDLRYITDNNAKRMRQVLMSLPWVQDIVKEGENVDTVIESARNYKYYRTVPKRMAEALVKAGATVAADGADADGISKEQLPLSEWGDRVGELFDDFPCLREVCMQLPAAARPAALFVGGAFLGTLMTRTWYYFYHRPEERRRLNYCVMIIGDPASGKSFSTKLYKVLAAPIKYKDQVGYDAINRYKRERQERTTSSKAQKGEALKKPEVIIRDHPSRTSNASFIADMIAAVETVDGEPMHLHMLTFDSELDNATLNQRGGTWIDKSSMELKAFHNEEDGQVYSNLDSVSGTFHVYWNYVYTGTPLSLKRKVTERNFGSGLATRLAVIPLPSSNFSMMELQKMNKKDHAAEELMKTWAYKLDEVHGELPLWPIVEEAWKWCDNQMLIAKINNDKAAELLMKRVPYYGVCLSAPFILMRHYDEWKEKQTLSIDEKDLQLARLIMDIQYQCQQHFFGNYARSYFDDMQREADNTKQIPSKYDMCFDKLPNQFSCKDVSEVYQVKKSGAYKIMSSLEANGKIKKIECNKYQKL